MHENLLLMFAVGTLGFLTTFFTIPFVQRIAIRNQIMAYPGGGGITRPLRHSLVESPIYIPFAVVFCAYYFVASMGGDSVSRLESRQMLSLFLGTTLIHIIGTYDDVMSMGWGKSSPGRFVPQAFSCWVDTCSHGLGALHRAGRFRLVWQPAFLSYPFWLLPTASI